MPESQGEGGVNVQRALFDAVYGDGNGKRGLLRSVAVLESKVDSVTATAEDTNRLIRERVLPTLTAASAYMADLPSAERRTLNSQTHDHMADEDRHIDRRAERKDATAWRRFIRERFVLTVFAIVLAISTAAVNARVQAIAEQIERLTK